jgi:hypothetical protein
MQYRLQTAAFGVSALDGDGGRGRRAAGGGSDRMVGRQDGEHFARQQLHQIAGGRICGLTTQSPSAQRSSVGGLVKEPRDADERDSPRHYSIVKERPVSIIPSKLSSGFLLALLAALIFLAPSGRTYAQRGHGTTTRSFQTGLYIDLSEPALTKADADISMFGEGQPQPAGLSIMKFKSYETGSLLSSVPEKSYNFSRIVAVMVDEPYNSVKGDPCLQRDEMDRIYGLLAAGAADLKSVSPSTRFWVNFTDREIGWMMDGKCFFNSEYIDVISLDRYYDFFYPDVQPYYDWLAAHPATPQQQLALIPGTFYRPGTDDPLRQAEILQGYFDYANNANQSCNLPFGPRGVTGSYDGCRVWMVLGWPADSSYADPNSPTTLYVGELDPRLAATVGEVWRAEVALPLRPGLAHQLTRGQILNTVLPVLLNN